MCRTLIPSAVALAAALLAACGGGDSRDATVTAIRAVPAERAQALASVGAKELFDWAAYKYPDLLGGSSVDLPGQIPFDGKLFAVRYVPGKNAYMGLDNTGGVWALAPFTGGALASYGPLSGFVAMIQADSCSVYPGSCGGGTTTPGPLNGCSMPAEQALVTGNRFTARYETTGVSAGTSDIEAVVDGPNTFEGQAAIRTSSTVTITMTVAGMTQVSTSRSRSFEVAASGGFISTLGHESDSSFGGFTSTSRTIYNPADLNSEYGLSVGQSFTKTSSGTSTTTTPGLPSTPTAFSHQDVHTYEARETITVRGKSYDTCRYRNASPLAPSSYTLQWFVYGKGFAARIQTFDGSTVTSTSDLVSGTINGAPI